MLATRNIDVQYKPYEEDMTEKVVVTVKKYTGNVGTVWEGIPVTISYDGKDTMLNTDSNGQVNTFIPLGKEYTVKVEDTDGYYVNFYKNNRTYKASFSESKIEVYATEFYLCTSIYNKTIKNHIPIAIQPRINTDWTIRAR